MQTNKLDRRGFILLLGSATAALPMAAHAQILQKPVIGFLSSASPEIYATRLRVFREGLKEAGYIEGQNVTVEYRWAQGHYDRLPALVAELVERRVAVIVAASGTPGAIAAKAATTTIPIVFGVAVDPVEAGLVTSLNQPGGNLTGVTNLNVEVGPKRHELMHELLPAARIFAVLVDPTSRILAEAFLRDIQAPARELGLELHVLHASDEHDFETVFASLAQLKAAALIIGPGAFFAAWAKELAVLTVGHAVPAIFQYRQFVAAGGLMSYGTNETEYYRLVGLYTGRILNGEKPGDLPVQQSTRVELLINLQTAQVLGLTVPLPLLGRADEVIE